MSIGLNYTKTADSHQLFKIWKVAPPSWYAEAMAGMGTAQMKEIVVKSFQNYNIWISNCKNVVNEGFELSRTVLKGEPINTEDFFRACEKMNRISGECLISYLK